METINELARETPIIHRTEVLVVGSGPGGLAAAFRSQAGRVQPEGADAQRLQGQGYPARAELPDRKDGAACDGQEAAGLDARPAGGRSQQ